MNRPRVFCASLADIFDNQVDPTWREDTFAIIRECKRLDWLLLTKRPQNAPSNRRVTGRPLDGRGGD